MANQAANAANLPPINPLFQKYLKVWDKDKLLMNRSMVDFLFNEEEKAIVNDGGKVHLNGSDEEDNLYRLTLSQKNRGGIWHLTGDWRLYVDHYNITVGTGVELLRDDEGVINLRVFYRPPPAPVLPDPVPDLLDSVIPTSEIGRSSASHASEIPDIPCPLDNLLATAARVKGVTMTSSSLLQLYPTDRLTCLPDEVLAQILSWLPTKVAAASQVLSKRMPRAFCCITRVDLDDSLISHCEEFPHLVERSSLFESFVDNVLHKLSQSQQLLTRFRLRSGGDKTTFLRSHLNYHSCRPTCFPSLEPAHLYAWISYPLAHSGLRELDLSFHVPNPAEFKFPPGLFARQSLEVLTLDSNLEINSSTEIPPICLPNLRILNLHSFVFNDHNFVTRLVSNCPALEDLSITCCLLEKADHLTISSQSLQRFSFAVFRHEEERCIDLVLSDTPNLQYFRFPRSLPIKYIVNMNALVEARIYVPCPQTTLEAAIPYQLSLARALSNVQYLYLFRWFAKGLYYASRLRKSLPMFHNLKTLKLDAFCDSCCSARWDIVLLLIFHRSPLLEELVFMEGFFGCDSDTCDLHKPDSSDAAVLEKLNCVIGETIPKCCASHLKRIRIYNCFGRDEELNMIRFLLGKTSVLEELVISMSKEPGRILFDALKLDQFKNTLEAIPRTSNTCSITYSDDEPDYKKRAGVSVLNFVEYSDQKH